MLDALAVGMCLYDEHDRAQVWNDTFLRIFPEHAGHIHRGEPYGDNLRRFYRQAGEPAQIERYVQAGIARHRQQFHPFDFTHHGRQVSVSSLPLAGIGRLRLWRQETAPREAQEGGARHGPVDTVSLLDRVPSGLMLCDGDGRILWANGTFATMYGLGDARAALGRTLQEVFHESWMRAGRGVVPPGVLQQVGMVREMMRFAGAPFELALPGGRHCRVAERPDAADAGHLYAHLDITELVRQRERLAHAEREARSHAEAAVRESALLQAVLRGMEQGLALVNDDGRVEYHNQRLPQLLGLPAEALHGQPQQDDIVRQLRERGDLEALTPEALALLLPATWDGPVPALVLRQRSSGRILEVGSVAVPGGGMLHTVADVTERYTHQQHIEHLASHDGLTGLLNRRRFMELLAAEIALAQRTGASMAVLYLDLDGFKPLNDTHGHAAGDRMLLHVAQVLTGLLREGDFAARLGGDEFAVLQRGVATREQAQSLAQRLRQSVQVPVQDQGLLLRIGISVGIALYPQDGTQPQALMIAADRAMYQAKGQARPPAAAAPSPLPGSGPLPDHT